MRMRFTPVICVSHLARCAATSASCMHPVFDEASVCRHGKHSGMSKQMRDSGLRLAFNGCVSTGVRCADYSRMHLAFDEGG